MALDKDALGTLIKSKISQVDRGWTGYSDTELTTFCKAIADAIVEHIQANAVATVNPSTHIGTVL